jgi:hypothetical protein
MAKHLELVKAKLLHYWEEWSLAVTRDIEL